MWYNLLSHVNNFQVGACVDFTIYHKYLHYPAKAKTININLQKQCQMYRGFPWNYYETDLYK